MIVEIVAFEVCCDTPGCKRTYGVPSRSEHRAQENEEAATHLDGWERVRGELLCPQCARQRWQRECACNLVLSDG